MNRFFIAALCAAALTGGAAVNSGFGTLTASAQQAAPSADGFEYSLSDDGNVTITKCISDKAEIVIPAQIDGRNVLSVAKGAFYGLADIKSITFESDTTVPEEGSAGFIAEGAKAEGVVIICGSSSAAKEYADKNGFETKLTDITDISSAVIALDKEEFTYDGNAKKPTAKVTLDGKELSAGQDYDVSYSGNINAGQALVTVSAKGSYTGTVTKSFTIKPAKIASSNVTLSGTSYTYSGKAITPTAAVTVGNRRLVKDTDYTLTFSGNGAVGTAYATVTGKGNYEGAVRKSFSIKLANVTGLKSKAADDSSVTLSWKKTAGATGYKVYLVNLTSGKYTLKADVKTNSAKVSGLAVGTKYKFAVRAYRKQGAKTHLCPSYSSVSRATAPAKVSFTVKTTQKGKAALSWTKVKNATSYAVFYKQKKSDKWTRLATLSGKKTSYTVKNMSGSKGGYLTVKAYIKYGGATSGGKFSTKAVYKYQKAAIWLDGCGWDLQSAFRACVIPWVGAGLPTNGTTALDWYASYGFDHGYGHCYVMAAMFTEMAKTMGYNCKLVNGGVPLAVGGIGPHSWAELTLGGVTYICDPDFQGETGRNGYCIIYGTPGTWRYTKYSYIV